MIGSPKRDDSHLIETRVSSEAVFDGKLLHVRRDTVRLPDGSLATREHVVHPGAVLIVPVLPDGRLVVERQYRYPLDRVFIEFPAGKLDPGETDLATAQRELIEEAGYTATTWTRARDDPHAHLVHQREDRDLPRRGLDARRREARCGRVSRHRDPRSSTRCWRHSTAARSPTPRLSRRCCSTRGGLRAARVIARRVVVRGRVQGVGFAMPRATPRSGFASPDGCAIVATAPSKLSCRATTDAVAAIIAWCRRGPSAAQVTDVEVVESELEPIAGFTLRPTA